MLPTPGRPEDEAPERPESEPEEDAGYDPGYGPGYARPRELSVRAKILLFALAVGTGLSFLFSVLMQAFLMLTERDRFVDAIPFWEGVARYWGSTGPPFVLVAALAAAAHYVIKSRDRAANKMTRALVKALHLRAVRSGPTGSDHQQGPARGGDGGRPVPGFPNLEIERRSSDE